MRNALQTIFPLLLIAGISAVLPSSARAQDDPPGRVARLNYTQGSVSFQVSGDSDWVQADPNRPLTTGDNIWADKDSRAEVHIDSTAIRLSSETGLSFLNLDDRTVQLQLPQGSIEVHLRQLSAGDAFEVDTPNLAFTLTRAGEYMITTDPNGSATMIAVREGEGEVTGAGDSWDLRPGQSYAFAGTDQLSYDAQPLPGFTDFEAWCQTRDQRENSSVSAKYVSRDVDGYYDLDDYGDWSNDSDYGQVWYPRSVASDWQPYHVGHWVFIAPWGWTWVDEEPWGFAPFHYGRWAIVGARWGWIPGPVVQRPVYAPALVGFVGGNGFGLSITIGGGFSGVAWFPLGPRDVFVPAYHCSPRYVQVVNVTNTRVVNVTQVTNVYNTVIVNRDVTHMNYTYQTNTRAVTAVSRDTFVNARSVTRESVRINDTQIRDVHVVSNVAPPPSRTSYVSATAKMSQNRPAVPFAQRPVVANLSPRVPLQNQRPNGNPRNVGQTQNGRPGQNTNPNGGQNNGQPVGGQPNGGQPNVSNNNSRPTGNGSQTQSNNGFHSFGPGNNNNNAAQSRSEGTTQAQPNNNAPGKAPNQPANGAPNAPVNTPPNGTTPNAPRNMTTIPGGAPNDRQNNDRNSGFRPFQPGNQAQSNGQQPNANQPSNNNREAGNNSNNNSNSNNNNNSNNSNTGRQQTQANDQQRYRFSPPVKAKDDNYDVHPSLNQNQPKPPAEAAQPKPDDHQNAPPKDNSSKGSTDSKPPRDNNNRDNRNH